VRATTTAGARAEGEGGSGRRGLGLDDDGLLAAHIGLVLKHQLVDRDRLLERML
jgi:hypothetical protein